MKQVEVESFIKSFLLFFVSLTSVIWFLVYQSHKNSIHTLEDTIFAQMQIASLGNNPQNFKKLTIPKDKNIILNTFYSDKKELSAYFQSRNSNDTVIKISYPRKSFDYDEKLIFKQSLERFLKSLLVIFIISILFSTYALYPYRRYLKLTDEFIKDILHDFNTPISTMRLNLSLLKKKAENKNLQRIEGGIETILNLQNNLKEYLENDIKKSEKFNIKETIAQRVEFMQGAFPYIRFYISMDEKVIYCYKDGFIRIIDNILSNACKYNKKHGSVSLILKDNKILEIRDTGNGIKKPKKIFNRFYKETSRGLGIGLHLVKKLSKKMQISLQVDSKIDVGTTFKLDLSRLILN
ncbi:MAG: HAMP domain-containing histidine kinase [Campylobacteraceae bacterium]|nr:HAMP domain-containing histidine kinase [Campylobacteraceae bacterium]